MSFQTHNHQFAHNN